MAGYGATTRTALTKMFKAHIERLDRALKKIEEKGLETSKENMQIYCMAIKTLNDCLRVEKEPIVVLSQKAAQDVRALARAGAQSVRLQQLDLTKAAKDMSLGSSPSAEEDDLLGH